jgi:hypothetical protein
MAKGVTVYIKTGYLQLCDNNESSFLNTINSIQFENATDLDQKNKFNNMGSYSPYMKSFSNATNALYTSLCKS